MLPHAVEITRARLDCPKQMIVRLKNLLNKIENGARVFSGFFTPSTALRLGVMPVILAGVHPRAS